MVKLFVKLFKEKILNMKNTLLLLFCCCLLTVGCNNDDDDVIEAPEADLFYDSTPQDAPALDPGIYDLGARFPASVMANYNGRSLEEVSFYILSVPSKCELLIFGQGTETDPGSLLYTADLTSSIDGEMWNTHTLSTPLDLSEEDLWICVRVEHNSRIGSLGCDDGPAAANGDWMFPHSSNEWTSLRAFSSNVVNINWNIRGKLNEI